MIKDIKKIAINIGLVGVLLIISLFIMFNVYLPSFTNHGETITVPDVMGMNNSELSAFLSGHGLRYEIADSSYDAAAEPGAVLVQRPLAGKKVKENRVIYININMGQVPIVIMPKLKMSSIINATFQLDSLGLILNDSIRYRYSNLDGMVLGQVYKGSEIKAGTSLPKGSIISLIVGRKNFNAVNVNMIDAVGLPWNVVARQLRGLGLEPLKVYDPESTQPDGTVTRQNIVSGSAIKKGSIVDIWVAGTEPPPEESKNEDPTNE